MGKWGQCKIFPPSFRYSAFIPRSLMTCPHFLYSLCTWAANSSGVLAITSSPRVELGSDSIFYRHAVAGEIESDPIFCFPMQAISDCAGTG